MTFEKKLLRLMIVLSSIFLVLTIAFYPPKYAVIPLLFIFLFAGSNILLPANSEERIKKVGNQGFKVSQMVIGFAIMGCIFCLLMLWRGGHFSFLR